MTVTLILSFILMIDLFLLILFAVWLVKDRRLFTTAPKDIQAAVRDHEEPFRGAKILGWVLLIFCALVFAGCFVCGGYDGIKKGFSFRDHFFRFLSMWYLLKAFDIIGLDYFLLTKSHFFQHFYPETEGCEGYHNFGFNCREQLIRIVLFPFVSLLMAYIAVRIGGI